jgi:hypothetical protein
MPNYRVEVVVQHDASDMEDYLELFIEGLLMTGGMRPILGPVVFRMYAESEQLPKCPSR